KGAEQALRLSLKHQKIAFDKAPGLIRYRRHLGNSYSGLCEVLWRNGQVDEALQLTLQRRALWTKSSKDLYAVARDLAVAAQGLDAKQRDQYEAAALESLDMAITAGFKDRAKLLADQAFRSLKDRDGFNAVLA